MSKATIPNIADDHLPASMKCHQLDLVQAMNREDASLRAEDESLDSVIASMELGYRMQTEVPGLLDTSTESPEVFAR